MSPANISSRLRILVVEDHAFLRMLLTGSFHETHTVYGAATAKEGWNLYVNKAPDIVFLDIHLPDGSGHALARRMKEQQPRVYIVMTTASEQLQDMKEAQENRVEGFMVKPFDKKKIMGYIDQYLARANV